MTHLSSEERDQVRQIVLNASEAIAPFWPMRTMVAQNPLHGLEYLPFDQAVRKGKELLGGNGYLANEEYRQFYLNGRITKESFRRAFSRVGLISLWSSAAVSSRCQMSEIAGALL